MRLFPEKTVRQGLLGCFTELFLSERLFCSFCVADRRGVDLISNALPFGRLWYAEPNAVSNAINYAKFRSRSHDPVIRVHDEAGNVIETHEHTGDFKEW
jgi:hypothetical protein